MIKKLTSGQLAEEGAMNFLKSENYEILATNWRFKRLEADIICKKEGVIIFVEVKMRSSDRFGHPTEFVDDKKQKNMISLANAYLELSEHQGEIRFDIISLLKTKDSFDIEHIKDAFWHND